MAGVQSRLLTIRDLGPRFRGDERMLHGFHATGTRAPACVLRILAYIAMQQQRHRVSRKEAARPRLP